MLKLRLSKNRGKLAWGMPSVSKLNKVNLVQHLTASLYLLPLLGEILKQVQDDVGWCWLLAISFWLFYMSC